MTARVIDDGRNIAGEELFAIADAADERRAAPRADQLVRHVRVQHSDGVSALGFLRGALYGLSEQLRRGVFAPRDEFVQVMADEMRQNFRVRLRTKAVAALAEFVAQFGVVFDDAVVDDDEPA